MKSAVADTIRLTAFMRRALARLSMVNLSAASIAEFRDERLKQVSVAIVNSHKWFLEISSLTDFSALTDG